jgi:phospholipid/cholesterol/gamma-HCH transport system substrate-binding protein
VQGRSTEFRVGIFVTLALIVGFFVVFALGSRSSMFASRNHYHAVFDSVSGLRTGSPVRMAGIDVGTVDDVHFRDDGRAEVVFSVRTTEARFVTGPRAGHEIGPGDGASVATIGSKGLLGDGLIDLSPGTGDALADGAEVRAGVAGGIMSSAMGAIEDARPAIANIRALTDSLADEQFRTDLRSIAHNIAELTRMVREDDGTVHRLISDPGMADRVENTLTSLQQTSTELAATARNVRAITSEIRSGDGTAHELIYGEGGTRLVGSLADTAGEAATILRDVRTGDGNMHELLYGDSAGDLISNLTAMSNDLRAIVADIRAGRGTLGGLLMDSSIYEDVRRIVGNVERNDILRALVRYSLREDEPRPPAPRPTESSDTSESTDPTPAP